MMVSRLVESIPVESKNDVENRLISPVDRGGGGVSSDSSGLRNFFGKL